MKSKEINNEALSVLAKQNWDKAQMLFFENAKKNPSHETLNNLGFYLITEGISCKNGTVRNALSLGAKYLMRALKLKESHLNLFAIAKYFDYRLKVCKSRERESLYRESLFYLTKALFVEYSHEANYNLLRMKSFLNIQDESIVKDLRVLLKSYVSSESVSLYLEILRANSLLEEGLECIKSFRDFVGVTDLLMFYARFGLYENGYRLCEQVYSEYDVDRFVASAIIECCINTHRFDEAREYALKIKNSQNAPENTRKDSWRKKVVVGLKNSTPYRQQIISDYSSIPPFVDKCCYYGCVMHENEWG